MVWPLAMLALLPLILLQRSCGAWPVHKLRTWAALLGSSAAAWFFAYLIADSYAPMWLYGIAFALFDLVAFRIITRRPAGVAQHYIGVICMLMFASSIGFSAACFWFRGDVDTLQYERILHLSGWGQFAILLAWSIVDVGGHFVHRLRRLGHLPNGQTPYGAGRSS
jgi:hypothetical protein